VLLGLSVALQLHQSSSRLHGLGWTKTELFAVSSIVRLHLLHVGQPFNLPVIIAVCANAPNHCFAEPSALHHYRHREEMAVTRATNRALQASC
jgi:hypothetical protein